MPTTCPPANSPTTHDPTKAHPATRTEYLNYLLCQSAAQEVAGAAAAAAAPELHVVDTSGMPHPALVACWHADGAPAAEWRVRYRRRGTPLWEEAGAAAGFVPARGGGASGAANGDGGHGGRGGGAGEGRGLVSVGVWEGLAAASDYEVQVRRGAGGAWGRSAWARTGGVEECPKEAGRALLATLGVGAAFFNAKYDRCYCSKCYPSRWKDVIQEDGPRPYVIPRGWVRYGLKLSARAEAMGEKFFKEWCVSFHGAEAEVCKQILEEGGMLLPGDKLLDNSVLRSQRCAGRQDKWFYTSPTARYAGLRFYAKPRRFVDAAGRDMFGQVLVCTALVMQGK